jgi:tRNA(Arg) A34 adenosine deaminase TadA
MDELSSKMKSMYQLSLKEAARSNVWYRLGCIATYGGKIIGRACNTSKFSKETCTCHAEVNVLDNLYNTYTRIHSTCVLFCKINDVLESSDSTHIFIL